jgi:hypothetical protein
VALQLVALRLVALRLVALRLVAVEESQRREQLLHLNRQ